MDRSTSETVPRAMDALTIMGLVQLIYGITKAIIRKAEQVHFHKKKCGKFARNIAEINNSLEAAKLESYKNQKFNKFAEERLYELKETLSHAEHLLGELESRRKAVAARISGEASKRIDELERDIEKSINRLNFHVLVVLLSEFSAAQPMSPNTYQHPFPHYVYNQQMLHRESRSRGHFPAAYPSPPSHHHPHYDPETATNVFSVLPPRNSFRLLPPIQIPSLEYRVQDYDPKTANDLFLLLSTTQNP